MHRLVAFSDLDAKLQVRVRASQSSADGALHSLEEVVKLVKLVDMLSIPYKILTLRSQLNRNVNCSKLGETTERTEINSSGDDKRGR